MLWLADCHQKYGIQSVEAQVEVFPPPPSHQRRDKDAVKLFQLVLCSLHVAERPHPVVLDFQAACVKGTAADSPQPPTPPTSPPPDSFEPSPPPPPPSRPPAPPSLAPLSHSWCSPGERRFPHDVAPRLSVLFPLGEWTDAEPRGVSRPGSMRTAPTHAFPHCLRRSSHTPKANNIGFADGFTPHKTSCRCFAQRTPRRSLLPRLDGPGRRRDLQHVEQPHRLRGTPAARRTA